MIPEALYTDWVSKNIADFFSNNGYRVRYSAVSQPVEATFPFDRFYSFQGADSPICIFALQFKSPKRRQKDLAIFSIDSVQLGKLQNASFRDWVWYALPYFTVPDFQQSALHFVNFTRPLQIPNLKNHDPCSLRWHPPFMMLEFGKEAHPEPKELEMYKVFDGFAPPGLALTRRACTVFPDGTLRYEVPHVSWGELVNLLLTLKGGRYLLKQHDIEDFIAQMKNIPVRIQNSIIGALDLIKRTIELLVVLPDEGGGSNDREEPVLF
ncbi:MAG: hypothetical protein C4548_02645 [Desulfobacteraceae bacterium]|jgi:hypothetical protein|nr:MAG: hypothetical protein C4548_02645 [Desulfobacteraceae bacterium]